MDIRCLVFQYFEFHGSFPFMTACADFLTAVRSFKFSLYIVRHTFMKLYSHIWRPVAIELGLLLFSSSFAAFQPFLDFEKVRIRDEERKVTGDW